MNEKQQELYEKLLKKVNEFCLGQAAEDVIEVIDDLVDSYESRSALEYLQDRYTLKKQSTPLQALDELVENLKGKYNTLSLYDEERIEIVKTALKEAEKNKKAIEMLKHNISLDFTHYSNGDRYEVWLNNGDEEQILIADTKEEYELLKEVLK